MDLVILVSTSVIRKSLWDIWFMEIIPIHLENDPQWCWYEGKPLCHYCVNILEVFLHINKGTLLREAVVLTIPQRVPS